MSFPNILIANLPKKTIDSIHKTPTIRSKKSIFFSNCILKLSTILGNKAPLILDVSKKGTCTIFETSQFIIKLCEQLQKQEEKHGAHDKILVGGINLMHI